MATLKKPKKLKYPKKPGKSASAAVLKRYLERCKEVDKRNQQRMSDYNKEKKARETLKKQIESIRRK